MHHCIIASLHAMHACIDCALGCVGVLLGGIRGDWCHSAVDAVVAVVVVVVVGRTRGARAGGGGMKNTPE